MAESQMENSRVSPILKLTLIDVQRLMLKAVLKKERDINVHFHFPSFENNISILFYITRVTKNLLS